MEYFLSAAGWDCTSSVAPTHWVCWTCISHSLKYLKCRFFQRYLSAAFGPCCVSPGECFLAGAAVWAALVFLCEWDGCKPVGDLWGGWCCSAMGACAPASCARQRELPWPGAASLPSVALGERWKNLSCGKMS